MVAKDLDTAPSTVSGQRGNSKHASGIFTEGFHWSQIDLSREYDLSQSLVRAICDCRVYN